jgi:hypothetical protein
MPVSCGERSSGATVFRGVRFQTEGKRRGLKPEAAAPDFFVVCDRRGVTPMSARAAVRNR